MQQVVHEVTEITRHTADTFGRLRRVRFRLPAKDATTDWRVLADRLTITLINRRQIGWGDFVQHEGGAVECTPAGRKAVITAYQARKLECGASPKPARIMNNVYRY